MITKRRPENTQQKKQKRNIRCDIMGMFNKRRKYSRKKGGKQCHLPVPEQPDEIYKENRTDAEQGNQNS